jgi:two-component system chemotaxis response regulator CheB
MGDIRVFVVDDSAVVRQVITQVLSQTPGIQVIGSAADPLFALDRMNKDWPDVLILDIEMPRMDGLTFLRKLMAERPTPVVICSTLAERGTETAMQALAAGAVGIITKPTVGLKGFLTEAAAEFAHAVRSAAHANLKRMPSPLPVTRPAEKAPVAAMARTTDRVVAIGTSTGGTQALEVVLRALPPVTPPIVIVQHMPEKFTTSFAARLNQLSAIEVREAQNGDRLLPGRALIAPGGLHMVLKRSGAQYYVEVLSGPPVNRHRPSVDVLFRSVAKTAGKNAVGILMTGMGNDGAMGLKEMKDAGAQTMAQDEATCVVYGMPKEAVKLGAVDRSLALGAIAPEIARLV